MSVSDADLQSLLHTLVEQQTALLNVQAENARLQRVLIERCLVRTREPSSQRVG